MQNMDLLALQQVLCQDTLQTLQDSDPLSLLNLALCQDQQRNRGQLRDQLRRSHLIITTATIRTGQRTGIKAEETSEGTGLVP